MYTRNKMWYSQQRSETLNGLTSRDRFEPLLSSKQVEINSNEYWSNEYDLDINWI